jgi:hypothetical protein
MIFNATPRPSFQTTVRVLDLLQKYGLLDDTGHMRDCGYSEELPNCKCSSLGFEIQQVIANSTS